MCYLVRIFVGWSIFIFFGGNCLCINFLIFIGSVNRLIKIVFNKGNLIKVEYYKIEILE